MRRYILILFLFLFLFLPDRVAAQTITTTTCPGVGCQDINTAGQGSIGIQITGTWVGTITFQSSLGQTSASTFTSLLVTPSNSTTAVTTTTANGLWTTPIAGINQVRVVFTAYTSGTANILFRITNQARSSGGGGGGGLGTVTQIDTTSPITGGPITTTGTIACATCGVTDSPLSQFASTTSAQLAGVISNETGSGLLTFATGPTLTGPVTIDGTGNTLIVDTTTLVVDSTNNRVGIGTATPGTAFQINQTVNAAVYGNVNNASAGAAAYAAFSASNDTGSYIEMGTLSSTFGVTGVFGPNVPFIYSPSSTGFALVSAGTGPILFATTAANTERMRLSNAGLLGIGVTPTAVVHIKAGTTAANTAPLKFNTGSLLTTAEAGAVEFLTDAFYGTITTGAARKTFAFLEAPIFTTNIDLDPAGVRLSGADGVLTILGLGNGNDENLTLDFDNAAANIVAIASGTGVTGLTWTGTFASGPHVITETVGASALTLTGATQTASFPLINMTQTWNNSGVAFNGINLNITNTASAASSTYMVFQTGANVNVTLRRDASLSLGTNDLTGITASGIKAAGLIVYSSGPIDFSSAAGTGADLTLTRDAAQTLAQRRTTNAQTYRLYETFTDASNYERGAFTMGSDALTLAWETAGTGTDNGHVTLLPAGTGSIQFALSGHVRGTGTAPTVGGSCGTSPSIVGTDLGGKLTTGTVAPTSCTITYARAYTNAPSCAANNETTANLVKAISTTTTLILSGTFVASDVLTWICVGY